MVLGEPDAVEAELLRPHHLLDLLTDDVGVRDRRRSLEEVIGAEAHRGGSTLHHLAMKIDQQRGVIAGEARARPDAPAPVVPDVPQSWPRGVVDERLIEPKAVASVRGVPGVGARLAVAKAERVEPSRALQPRQPGVFLRARTPESPRRYRDGPNWCRRRGLPGRAASGR